MRRHKYLYISTYIAVDTLFSQYNLQSPYHGQGTASDYHLLLLSKVMIFISSTMQGNDVGTQYRSGIYYYSPEQEKSARETLERHEKTLGKKVVTEILPAKKFYRAEEYHQQYLEKGGRVGSKQSASKGCTDPIRCYG